MRVMASSRTERGIEPDRQQPRQTRSRQRVEQILNAAAEVLVERGYDGTTLKLVADRAGIKQTSIYRYWPNKQAIVRDLVDGFIASQDAALVVSEEQLSSGMGWQEVLADYMRRLRQTVERDKWISPCHNAMISDPDLSDQDRKVQDHFSKRFADVLRATGLPGEEDRRSSAGRMMAVLLDSFVLSLNRHVQPDHETIEREMGLIVGHYIESNFGAEPE